MIEDKPTAVDRWLGRVMWLCVTALVLAWCYGACGGATP